MLQIDLDIPTFGSSSDGGCWAWTYQSLSDSLSLLYGTEIIAHISGALSGAQAKPGHSGVTGWGPNRLRGGWFLVGPLMLGDAGQCLISLRAVQKGFPMGWKSLHALAVILII